jgi:hypothetical protein
MRNDQPAASALFGCESGLLDPEIGLEHDKWQNLNVLVCKNNCKLF